jgi:hypothetical protein
MNWLKRSKLHVEDETGRYSISRANVGSSAVYTAWRCLRPPIALATRTTDGSLDQAADAIAALKAVCQSHKEANP